MSERPLDADIIAMTRAWVANFVVAHDVCPFAGREVRRNSLRYVVANDDDPEHLLHTLIEECHRLDAEPAIETTLMILPEGLADFDDYLDLLGVADALLEAEGYAGIYQLASFHPDYVFEGVAASDPANYTNRSPWPMWHLLRERSVEAAVANHPAPESIPEDNVAALREIGSAALAEQWAACRRVRAND
ncbi:hypothetical protein SAMN05421509_103280 [Chromohalobacter canadensis]|uniref:DUF1415 domain-containing protein n=1 Tax=Chromohalobacter canadensis TaxID=141389 RepID=A0A285VM32_9GAMM|nr:DUF1415 domain-containing protein [Chromohalobacter canadensis]SOC54276.1 hypothetical protein SAMN05421509_103280 [Chromohalobacter canadensis]